MITVLLMLTVCRVCSPVDLVLDIAVVRGLSELGVSGQGGVHHQGQHQAQAELQGAAQLGGQPGGGEGGGETQPGGQGGELGQVDSQEREQVGDRHQGESHLLLAEAVYAGVGLQQRYVDTVDTVDTVDRPDV